MNSATKNRRGFPVSLAIFFALAATGYAWTPMVVEDDPVVRMPGSQPAQNINLEPPSFCINCHYNYAPGLDPGSTWAGSMMAQAARDPIFFATFTVAIQDSIWALGNPNAADICLRCHFPEGWLGGRSDPPNASAMTGSDYDGVHCDACHRLWNPFFETTYNGAREGNNWSGYWDEAGNTGPGSGTLSQLRADNTLAVDYLLSEGIFLFTGDPFFTITLPRYFTYMENAAGQYFVEPNFRKRGPFADYLNPAPAHEVLYSRYHKSKYFCSTCHDVSNPLFGNYCEEVNAAFNLNIDCLPDQSGGLDLITEQYSAFNFSHVERTFSEFMLSAYGAPGGAATNPEFLAQGAPGITWAAKCQDCHMPDVTGRGCEEAGALVRPDQSVEHPHSGLPQHDLTGGNMWMTYILATLNDDNPIFDQTNFDLLSQGPANITLNLNDGLSPIAFSDELLDASNRARAQLQMAGSITNLQYDPPTGDLLFRLQNNTGHKLISGFTEGRRMFVNIKAYHQGALVYEINPYDYTAGTMKGLSHPSSPALGPDEAYIDELVYECHMTDVTGTDHSFHFALSHERYKDNRIPPRGFDIVSAPARLAEPVWHGVKDPGYFTAAEYAGGYDEISSAGLPLGLPATAGVIEITVYYQGTSREYVEFLRDEINGTVQTLPSPTPSGEPSAYIVQTDPFFSQLRPWGNTIWQLWEHNHGLDGSGAAVEGIVPAAMTTAKWVLYGDLNGDGVVDSADMLLLAHYLAGNTTALAARFEQVDLNVDTQVTAGDLGILIDYLSGNLVSLPL